MKKTLFSIIAALAIFALPLSAMAACVDGSQSVASHCSAQPEETCSSIVGGLENCEWTGSVCQTNGLYLCSDFGPENCIEAVGSLGMCAWQPTQTSVAQAVDGLNDAGVIVLRFFFGVLKTIVLYAAAGAIVAWGVVRMIEHFQSRGRRK